MRKLNWRVITVEGTHVFIRKIPFLGVLAKIQRPNKLPDISTLTHALGRHDVRRIVIEAASIIPDDDFLAYVRALRKQFSIDCSPYIPTKTRIISLVPSLKTLFAACTSAKRRGVRRALKNGVLVFQSEDIDTLISIKARSAGLFGCITTSGLAKLWSVFGKHGKASILLAYRIRNHEKHQQCAPDYSSEVYVSHPDRSVRETAELVGGVLLVMWETTAYYWIAGSTKKGKKLFAPTLLVWEAIKTAKARGYTRFDFVGVSDERIPQYFKDWKGFTTFKEGFGGTDLYYPIHSV